MKPIHYSQKFLFIFFSAFCLFLSAGHAFGTQVLDSQGNRFDFFAPPKRVVSLVPTATEVLFELGEHEAIKGLTHHDATLRHAQGKPIIGGYFNPSIPKIKALNPDMVILSPFHKDVEQAFEHSKIPLFFYTTKSVGHSFENILALGRIFGRQDQAQEILETNKAQFEHIRQKLAKVPGKKKRVIRLMGRDTLMTPGKDSFQNDLIRLAGGIPPDFTGSGSVVEVSKQDWVKFNPQVIYGCGQDKKAAQAFFSRPGYKDVDAVKNGRIYYFPCDLTCRAATHSGYFVSWLSSMIHSKEFCDPETHVSQRKSRPPRVIDMGLAHVKSARITQSVIYDFPGKTLVIDFHTPQTIVSTLEGKRSGILSVGNHYCPPATWGPGHILGIEAVKNQIIKANGKKKNEFSFLITGADMDNLVLKKESFKDMEVTVLATAGVMSNAVRMSKDTGMFYEPGTINILILTNMKLSDRAMTRAIISSTEAKTAVLEDLDIRSSYTPLVNGATGTGTDNIIVVQGQGQDIDNAGGHTKMGELMARAVYGAVKEAVFRQNKITENRHIFQRLKERKVSIFNLVSGITCQCVINDAVDLSDLSKRAEHLMLEPPYAAFLESALALSDAYEKGLVRDLAPFKQWCLFTVSQIAGQKVEIIEPLVRDQGLPMVLETALNSILTGALEQLRHE